MTAPAASPPPVAVLEIGGTHVTAAMVDVRLRSIHERRRASLDPTGTAQDILAALAAAAASLDRGASRMPWSVAIPGPFDYARGIGDFTGVGKFGALRGRDLRAALQERIAPRPDGIVFVNDAEAFALGEWTGRGGTEHRALYVTLGTGLGSSFLVDGEPVADGRGIPPHGQIFRLRWEGRPIERAVSRRTLIDSYAHRTGLARDVHEIADAARAGDAAAARIFAESFRTLGICLAPCVAEFGADALVVGGSISGSWDLIEAPLAEGLAHGDPRTRTTVLRRADDPDGSPLVGAAMASVLRR
ncbi:ROK family protein [Microbacterium sp. NPDC056052]|uniref:ROK family protein n=1 Tax=Microbacterium sp. NPDC056052 TaxID=3345695 RepID=UPI0035D5FDEE